MENEFEGLEEGPKVKIHSEQHKKVSNWKTPDHDVIDGYWFKKFTPIHDRLALEMNRCLQEANVPKWMTKGKTTLIQKDPLKATTPNNYRLRTCLPMIYKILSAQREEINNSLTSLRLFLEEQKRCRKGSRGIRQLLFIDHLIVNESKTRRKIYIYGL